MLPAEMAVFRDETPNNTSVIVITTLYTTASPLNVSTLTTAISCVPRKTLMTKQIVKCLQLVKREALSSIKLPHCLYSHIYNFRDISETAIHNINSRHKQLYITRRYRHVH